VTLAGNVVIVLLAIALIGYGIRSNLHRLRREKPLREEMRTRPATFQAQIGMRSLRGPVSLSVHGDILKIAQQIPVIGFVNGSDYSYRAQDTTLETVHGRLHDWIEICVLPGTGAEPVQIGRARSTACSGTC
jgi:hypothetical protein